MFEHYKRRKISPPPPATRGVDWSEISGDILSLIADKINIIEDYVRFCAVCRPWYLFATDHNYFTKKKSDLSAPFLLLRDDDSSKSKRMFRNFASGKRFLIDLPEEAAGGGGRRLWGSPFGWLVTFGGTDLEFSLVNPFSKATLPLPSLRTLLPAVDHYDPNRRFIKAILTASPDSPDCVVYLITNPSGDEFVLGFAKPGRDDAWSRIVGPSDLNDIVCFEGNVYGSRWSSTEIVLIQPPRAVVFAPAQLVPGHDRGNGELDPIYGILWRDFKIWKYLVDLGGQLCLVLRYVGHNLNLNQLLTLRLSVFVIDMSTKKFLDCSLSSLSGHCLFIGNNYSFACLPNFSCATSHPVLRPVFPYCPYKPIRNSIYYTHDDDLSSVGCNEGTFYLPDSTNYKSELEESLAAPPNTRPLLWITPSLRFHRLEGSDGPSRCSEWLRRCSDGKLTQSLNDKEIKNDMKVMYLRSYYDLCSISCSKCTILLYCD